MTTDVRSTKVWHSQAHMPTVQSDELVIERGSGEFVWDKDGNRYFDAAASLWFANVGHGRREIGQAVAKQIEKLECYHSFGRFVTEPALSLADRLYELVPLPDAKFFFTSGGSDGVDLAAKLARRYWAEAGKPEKRAIVSRKLAYHGLHAFGTSITGLDANLEGLGRFVPETFQVDHDSIDSLRDLLSTSSSAIAAFIAEPVMGTGGVRYPNANYLEEAQALCASHDVLFILDEVITGFGRLGSWFGSHTYGLAPDLMVLAKGITSGYMPLGAVVASPRVAEVFWGSSTSPIFRHGMTYSGHAAACAAALVNLDIIEKEDLLTQVVDLSEHLDRRVQQFADLDGVSEVRSGLGLMAGVELASPALAERVSAALLDRGHIVRVIAGSTLQLSPPFVTEQSVLDSCLDAIGDLITTDHGNNSKAIA